METTKSLIKPGLSGCALKWIAIVTMLIDHIGATLVESLLLQGAADYGLYYLLRCIGRAAFPIFCFLLTEGMEHTHSRGRYALRLGLFCLIAEIPFDLAFNSAVLEFSSQNVFFTLLLGFLAMCACERLPSEWPRWSRVLAQLGILIVFGLAAEGLATDYGGFGVALILALYWGGRWPGPGQRWRQALPGSAAILAYCAIEENWIELYAVAGLALTLLYNGERGRQNKYFFYIFYPAHLLILSLLTWLYWHSS